MNNYEITLEEINGYNIETVDVGDKSNPVIVFAHGLGGNLWQWNEQIAAFRTKYRVIAFSLQGHGHSSKPDNMEDYKIESYSDILMSLLKSKNITSCIWVGNSMGGVIGYEILKRDSSLITHLVTNGTAPKLQYGNRTLRMIKVVDNLLIKVLGFEHYINIAVNASLKEESKRKALKDIFIQAHPKAIISSHQLLGNYDYLEVIRNCCKRVSIVMTPNDKDINKAINKNRSYLENVNNVKLYETSNGGHIFNIECPSEYNSIIMSIINKTI